MKNVNMIKVKEIFNDLTIEETQAVLKIAREFEKENFLKLDQTARKFIAYKDGEELNPIHLLNELADTYNL